MAEQNPKRQREESDDNHKEESKRHKPHDQILPILEEEQDVYYIQDLSDIFTDIQQELSFEDSAATGDDLHISPSPVADSDQNSFSPDEDDDKLSMMRHLLEASDDELGIPNRLESGDEGAATTDDDVDGGGAPVGYSGDGFWEFEDEAANYYAMLQSELLM